MLLAGVSNEECSPLGAAAPAPPAVGAAAASPGDSASIEFQSADAAESPCGVERNERCCCCASGVRGGCKGARAGVDEELTTAAAAAEAAAAAALECIVREGAGLSQLQISVTRPQPIDRVSCAGCVALLRSAARPPPLSKRESVTGRAALGPSTRRPEQRGMWRIGAGPLWCGSAARARLRGVCWRASGPALRGFPLRC